MSLDMPMGTAHSAKSPASGTLGAMDFLFTPWRYSYIVNADKIPGCLFCEILKKDDRAAWILHRGVHSFIMLNAFPYTSGHVMIVPYAHVDELHKVDAAAAHEMTDFAQKMESVLREVYQPDGLNLGMNLGRAGGAGVAGHVHMHLLPRWVGDTNFMTVVGETRVVPESLEQTYEKLKQKF